MRADNYSLSEETKRVRDGEQGGLTDEAYEDAARLLVKHRAPLDRIAQALLEKETLERKQLDALLDGVPQESRNAETVGTVRASGRRLGRARLASPGVDARGSTTSVSLSTTSTTP